MRSGGNASSDVEWFLTDRNSQSSVTDLLSSFQRPNRDEPIGSSRPQRYMPLEVGAFTLFLPSCQPPSIFYFRVRPGFERPRLIGVSAFQPASAFPSRVGASTPWPSVLSTACRFFSTFGSVSEDPRLIGFLAFRSGPGDVVVEGCCL